MRRTVRLILALACLAAAPAIAAEVPIQTGEPKPLPPLAFQTMDGQETTLGGVQGQGRRAQSLGHLVRTLPRGNALPRPSAGAVRRP